MISLVEQSKSPSVTEIQQRGLAAKYGDVAEFSLAVHDWKTEPYQDAWAEALESENKLLIICPPDTYKSSTVQCWIEKTIGVNPNIRILWLMKAGSQAQARVMAVAETLENNLVYREAFPDIQPNKNAQWSKTALYVKRSIDGPDPTLMGCGFNGPYQGLHFDVIIVDDPTNQGDVKSPATMESQRLKLRGVILDRLIEGGRFVAIMTRWGEDDLVPTFKDMGFKIVTMPIIGSYPWGPTISNRRFPLDRCAQIRHDKTDAIFDLTYMCDPQAMDGGIIRREYLRYWSNNANGPNYVPLPTSPCLTIMAVDLASSTQTWADPTCIGTALLEMKSRSLYVTELFTKRMDVMETETQLLKRAQHQANLVQIGVETVGFQLSFLQRMRRQYALPFRELQYRSRRQAMVRVSGIDRNKTERAISVAQMFNASRLYLGENLGYHDGMSVESELCGFPFMKHDDRLDVIAFLCGIADTYVGQKVKVKLGRR